MNYVRDAVCAAAGVVGGLIAAAFGGWTSSLTVLMVLMGIDYLTGLAVAGIFHASPKSSGGGLESRAGWRGLVRKVVTLALVLIGHMVDVLLGAAFVRDAVAVAFAVNELISITENAALMGVPIPAVLLRAIDALKKKEADNDAETD